MSDPTVGGGRVGFVVGTDGTTHELYVSAKMSAAYDILTDAGYSPDKSAEVAAAAERAGEDPEAIARKMIRLRDSLRATVSPQGEAPPPTTSGSPDGGGALGSYGGSK